MSSEVLVPNLFGTRDQFCRNFSMDRVRGVGVVCDDSSELHLLCTLFLLLEIIFLLFLFLLFLLLLHQLHHRSSGLRSQRLGTPAVRCQLGMEKSSHCPNAILIHLLHLPCELQQTSCMCVYAKSLQLCPTLCNLMDYSPPGSSVHGILQDRKLDWVAISSSKVSS